MKRIKLKEIKVICPNCGAIIVFKNWFSWVWHCPFHWFGKRRVKCFRCDKKSFMKRIKEKK